MRRRTILASAALQLAAATFPITAAAAPRAAVRYLPEQKIWVLESDRTTYVLGLNEQNALQTVYWGKRLARLDGIGPRTRATPTPFESGEGMTAEEYPGWGGLRYAEPCLKVTFADGVRDLVLKYVAHEIHGDTLTLRVKDIEYDLFADLIYRVFPRHGMLAKRAPISTHARAGDGRERASGVWYLPPADDRLPADPPGRPVGGRNAAHPGADPARQEGAREPARQHQPPGQPLVRHRRAAARTRSTGRVWFGALAWSGNWRIAVEQTPTARCA